MQELIREWVELFGAWGVFVLIAAENLFPPIPSEVILTFSGFLTTCTQLTPVSAVLSSTAGSVIGAIVLYAVGRLLGKERLKVWLSGKWGNLLKTSPEDIETACKQFEKRGSAGVCYCRCIPIVRSLISIPAGITGMAFLPFLILTTFGSLIWNIILIGLGVLAGENWHLVAQLFEKASQGIRLILIAGIVLFVVKWIYKKMKKEYTLNKME